MLTLVLILIIYSTHWYLLDYKCLHFLELSLYNEELALMTVKCGPVSHEDECRDYFRLCVSFSNISE